MDFAPAARAAGIIYNNTGRVITERVRQRLPLLAAVGLAVGLGARLPRADEAQDDDCRHVGDHLEELIGDGDAGHLQTDLQRVAEAEEQAGKQNAARVPAAEDDGGQRDEAAPGDDAVGVGAGVAGGQVRAAHTGQTPVKSLGVTDQHSQVQLYTEGPFDKVITFIGVDKYRSTVEIPHAYDNIPDVAFLSGHTFNELIKCEQFATEYAVQKSGHMNCTVTLPEVNAFTVGQLLFLFQLETAFAGELLGINAFDQPGVEEGKNATYALLGKHGYDAKKKELDAAPKKEARYII